MDRNMEDARFGLAALACVFHFSVNYEVRRLHRQDHLQELE